MRIRTGYDRVIKVGEEGKQVARQYEVHSGPLPGETKHTVWIVYQTGDGGFDLVAWFADRDDADEYALFKNTVLLEATKRKRCPIMVPNAYSKEQCGREAGHEGNCCYKRMD